MPSWLPGAASYWSGTGTAVALPHGTVGPSTRAQDRPRAGLSIVNTPGTIDAGYRGEIKVCLINLDPDEPIVIKRAIGSRSWWCSASNCPTCVKSTSSMATSRGAGGYGSSGGTRPQAGIGRIDEMTATARVGEAGGLTTLELGDHLRRTGQFAPGPRVGAGPGRQEGGQVSVEMSVEHEPEAVYLLTPVGRVVSVPRLRGAEVTGPVARVVRELAESRASRRRVHAGVQQALGRELVAEVPGDETHRFIGVDGPRWMVRCVGSGPPETTDQLAQLARAVLAESVVRRADPVRRANRCRSSCRRSSPQQVRGPAADGRRRSARIDDLPRRFCR